MVKVEWNKMVSREIPIDVNSQLKGQMNMSFTYYI